MENSKQNSTQKIKAWLPGILISLVAVFVLVKQVNLKDLPAALAMVNPINIFIIFIIQVLAVCTRTLGWRALLNKKAPYWRSFFIVSIGYLLNNLFPLRAGEIGRSVLMGKANGTGTFNVLSSLVLERLFDMAFAAAMLLFTIPYVLKMEWAKQMGTVTLFIVAAGFLVLFLLSRYGDLAKRWVTARSPRWGFVQKWIVPPALSIIDGLEMMKSPFRLLQAVFWIGMSWVGYILTSVVILLPLVPNLPAWGIPFLLSVVALGMAVPSAPGGLGVYEAVVVGGLSLLNVPASIALAYALILHLVNYLMFAILGFWGLTREGSSLTSILSKAESPQSA